MTERIIPGARDLETLIRDVEDRYLPAYIPEIRDVGGNSIGRRYLRLKMALLDDGHLHTDQAYREGFLTTCEELSSAIRIAEDMFYARRGPTGARVTLRLTTINNAPAPVGGISIPQWTSFGTSDSPAIRFLSLAPVTILEGETQVTVAAVQGERRSDVMLAAGAPGTQDLTLPIPATKVELGLTQIRVNDVSWALTSSLADASPTDQVFRMRFTAKDTCEVIFGDGEYGQIVPAGAPVVADYVMTRGAAGGVRRGAISKVLGALATLITVTNPADSTTGFDGDALSDIQRRAPAALQTGWRAVHETDAETLAVGVPGVFRAQAVPEGALLRVYVQGDGGSPAPEGVRSDVLSFLQARRVTGTTIEVLPHTDAEILIGAQVILKSRQVDRAQARAAVLAALAPSGVRALVRPEDGSGVLHWSLAPFGRDLSLAAVARSMESPAGVDEVDITKLTRRPSVLKSNIDAPELRGLASTPQAVLAVTWVITAIDATTYQVAREGQLELELGTVGVTYVPSAGEATWTLGTSGDALTAGDTWTFVMSPYRGNVVLAAGEVPKLRSVTDADLSIVYSDEV